MSQGIELADFVSQLRAELARALIEGKDQTIKFDCGPVDLELEVAVERASDASARIRFWVVDAGISANGGTTTTQRIKMTLTPSASDTPREQLRIAGTPVPGER